MKFLALIVLLLLAALSNKVAAYGPRGAAERYVY